MSLKDFNIVTNVPYGNQVLSPKELKIKGDELVDYQPIQTTFRRFGKFIKENEMDSTYVVAWKMNYSNPLSFEKYSNVIWDKNLDFVNGGLNVYMLKAWLDKVNEPKETVKAYIAEY